MKLDHFSWSQLNTLYRCGEQYRRRYIMNDTVPPGLAIIRGKVSHRTQEVNLIHKMEHGNLMPFEAVLDYASQTFHQMIQGPYMIDGAYQDLSPAQALGLAKDETIDLSGLHAKVVAPQIEPSAIEVKIKIPASEILPVPMLTILDLIHAETTVIDTKTMAKSPVKSLADDSDQLTMQSLAFEARYKRPAHSLMLDCLVRTPARGDLKHVRQETQRTKADMQVLLERTKAGIKMVEAEVFLPAPADHWVCSTRFCGYADTCPYFRGRPRPTN